MMHKWQVLGGKKRSRCQIPPPVSVVVGKYHGTASEPHNKGHIADISDINIFLM